MSKCDVCGKQLGENCCTGKCGGNYCSRKCADIDEQRRTHRGANGFGSTGVKHKRIETRKLSDYHTETIIHLDEEREEGGELSAKCLHHRSTPALDGERG